jgi:polyisoprenoid-binding protein YceI
MQTQRVRSGRQTVWVVDPEHTTVEFSVKNFFFFIVKGCFSDLAGTIVLDEADIRRSSVEATIKAGSIDTGAKRRDAHMRSTDFLEADRYPDIRFQSTKVERGRDRDTLRITGSLTIRGKRREVVLDVNEVDHSRSPNGEEVAYYSALTELDRFDFGINYRRGMIGRTLKIAIDVQALRQQK